MEDREGAYWDDLLARLDVLLSENPNALAVEVAEELDISMDEAEYILDVIDRS